MLIPRQDIFLDSSHAEGLNHTWGSAFLFESQVSSDSSDSSFFSDPVLRWRFFITNNAYLLLGNFVLLPYFNGFG